MDFIKKYYREILQVILVLMAVILLYKMYSPVEDRSDLVDYKLKQIDSKINEIKERQKILNDSINSYQEGIKKIDSKLSDLKIERKTINNFFDKKKDTITQMDKRQVDSTLRKRYNY